jgi:hypothetical protein
MVVYFANFDHVASPFDGAATAEGLAIAMVFGNE